MAQADRELREQNEALPARARADDEAEKNESDLDIPTEIVMKGSDGGAGWRRCRPAERRIIQGGEVCRPAA